MHITRKEFADEERRMKALRKQGKDDRFVQSWLRAYRRTRDHFKRNHKKEST